MFNVDSGGSDTLSLPAQHVLSVTASNGVVRVVRGGDATGQSSQGMTEVASGATTTFGPFAQVTHFTVYGYIGSAEYSVDRADFPTAAESLAAAEASAAALTPIVGAVGDWRIIPGTGDPVDYTDGTPPATGEGVAGPGSLYINQTDGTVWRNSGTKAQPLWTEMADTV